MRQDELRGLVDRSPDAIYRYRLTDPRGFEFIADSITDIIGYTPADHYAQPDLARRIVHPDDAGIIERALAGGPDETSLTLRWIHRDGHIVWTQQRLRLVRDGDVVAVEGVVRALGERREPDVGVLAFGDLRLELAAARVTIAGRRVMLTPSEFRILTLLATRDTPVSRRELARRLWDTDDPGRDQAVEVHVSNLRRKLDPDAPSRRITTVKGAGYRLER